MRRRVESGVLANPDLSETVPLFVPYQLNSDAQIPQVEGLTVAGYDLQVKWAWL